MTLEIFPVEESGIKLLFCYLLFTVLDILSLRSKRCVEVATKSRGLLYIVNGCENWTQMTKLRVRLSENDEKVIVRLALFTTKPVRNSLNVLAVAHALYNKASRIPLWYTSGLHKWRPRWMSVLNFILLEIHYIFGMPITRGFLAGERTNPLIKKSAFNKAHYCKWNHLSTGWNTEDVINSICI